MQVFPLRTPIKIVLALSKRDGESEMVLKATKKAPISNTLDTNGNPLRLRNIEFLLFLENMPEVLLSFQ